MKIEFDGENFTADGRAGQYDIYAEIRRWLEANGGEMKIRGGWQLVGRCPIEAVPLFLLTFGNDSRIY